MTATKSVTGHLLGGAGAVESIFTVLSLRDRKMPATINVEGKDDEVATDIVRDDPRRLLRRADRGDQQLVRLRRRRPVVLFRSA